MPEPYDPILDEDLTPRFHWRWGEHGIYLAVCSAIALMVLALTQAFPAPPKRKFTPHAVELIQVRYLTAADEPPEQEEPFRDTRLIRPPRKQAQGHPIHRAM